MDKRTSNLLLFIVILAVWYVVLIILSRVIPNLILFQPPKTTYEDGPDIIKLTTRDGKKISAVYLPHQNSRYVILYSHGNAVDLGGLMPLLRDFHRHGYSIFAYDYHGYGTSEGSASEKNTYHDIDAAYYYLTHHYQIPPDKIVAMGGSLGAAVTLDLAARKPLAGIILEGPFISAFRVMTIIPILPFDKYNNLNKIKRIKIPVLIIHGTKDQTIPLWHGKRLFQEARSPKQALWVKQADHHNIQLLSEVEYWQAIAHFFTTLNHKHSAIK